MARFRVTIIHDACTTHDVEADTQDAAIGVAMDGAGVTLCNQCSDCIDLADPIRAAVVENLDTGESDLDADPDHEVVVLRRRVAELEAQVALLSSVECPSPTASSPVAPE
jgi:hypothetical protein